MVSPVGRVLDQRKLIKVKYNRENPAMCTVASDWAAIAGDDLNHVIANADGVQISAGAGKNIVLQCLSIKKPFVRETPFPFAMIPGMASPPSIFPDIPLLALLPRLAPMLQILALIGAAIAAAGAAAAAAPIP